MKYKAIIIIVALLILVGAYYYYLIDTLSISQILGKQNNPKATIVINLLDFDTGLTRYDIYRLNHKGDYWDRRVREVNSIRDPNRRNIENEKLLAEMMEDPSLKKIAKKMFGLEIKSATSILQAISN